MSIEDILTSRHFVLKPTTKWIAIYCTRPTFKKVFGSERLGKLQNERMYVTPAVLEPECERLIAAAGLTIHHLRSTDGGERTYPGFDTVGVPSATLEGLVDALYAAVEERL